MASRRRRRKSIGKVVTDVERRVRRVEKRPGATRLKRNVVTGEKIQYRAIPTKAIQEDAITANEAEFGTTFVTATEPTEYLKEGTTWFDPTSGATNVWDPTSEDFIEATAIDYTARASANGKNTVYRQDYEPTGGTYVLGDTWFDTDNDSKIHRYSTAITATVTNKSLTSNVATLTVSSAHTFVVGETITVSGVDATFNGSYEVSATPTALTVRYAKTASNVASTGSSGTITNTAGWKGFALGDGALINISASKIQAGELAAGVIVTSFLDADKITTGTLTGRTITGATITGSTFQLTQINSYGTFTIASNIYGSPSLTWGPTATPSFVIYQAAAGDSTVMNAQGVDGNGYLFINAGVRIELQAPEVFFFYAPKIPSGSTNAGIGSQKAIRNIYSTTTAGTPTGGTDGDIVVVHPA